MQCIPTISCHEACKICFFFGFFGFFFPCRIGEISACTLEIIHVAGSLGMQEFSILGPCIFTCKCICQYIMQHRSFCYLPAEEDQLITPWQKRSIMSWIIEMTEEIFDFGKYKEVNVFCQPLCTSSIIIFASRFGSLSIDQIRKSLAISEDASDQLYLITSPKWTLCKVWKRPKVIYISPIIIPQKCPADHCNTMHHIA